MKGARQIGKTESIREFAKANYSSSIEINFVEEPKYKTIIGEGYAAADIIKNISRIDPDKKFRISKVAKGSRFKDYRGCIEWLKDAGLVNICYCLQFPELPLRGNYDEEKYKLYYFDTGMLVAILDEEAQEDLSRYVR